MDMLLGLLLMLFGVVTLVKKELKLSGSKIARGKPATIAGLLLVLALPVAFLAQVTLGVLARNGTTLLGEATQATLTYVILVVMVIAALLVAARGTQDTA